jgi:hypothetical protein
MGLVTPQWSLRSSTHSGETSSGSRSSGTFLPVYAGVSKALIVAKCEAGSSGVPYCDNASVDVGGQSIHSIEDRLRDAAGLVDDHPYVAGMDALKCCRVVGGLAAVGDELVADVPLGIGVMRPGRSAFLWAFPCTARQSPDLAESSGLSLRHRPHLEDALGSTTRRRATWCGTSKRRALL